MQVYNLSEFPQITFISTQNSSTDEEIKSRILQSAMQFVPEHGWSQQSIQLAVEQEGMPSVAHGIFPR